MVLQPHRMNGGKCVVTQMADIDAGNVGTDGFLRGSNLHDAELLADGIKITRVVTLVKLI
ncbi:MAG: hypothetical protein HOI95_03675, partial [Chromatiales bacterium]|nr:hypothetical protein [Chromatiales bacterium]